MDWWDAVEVAGSDPDSHLTITCTPAQHGSGRNGMDANATLWSSWYLHHETGQHDFRAFFAGDTGFQFRDPSSKQQDGSATRAAPQCPAFEEIARRLGSPHLSLLPISVGATLGYLKSYDPFPSFLSPIPSNVDEGLTAANHMPASDAVRVFELMRQCGGGDGPENEEKEQPSEGSSSSSQEPAPVALAIHWGTFVQNELEAARSLRKLKAACEEHDVRFARSFDPSASSSRPPPANGTFVALNSGESFEMPVVQRT